MDNPDYLFETQQKIVYQNYCTFYSEVILKMRAFI